MSEKKTDIIEKIFSIYKAKTKKPDSWYLEKFDELSDMGISRLKNYLKVAEKL